jgi:hypothetical protein
MPWTQIVSEKEYSYCNYCNIEKKGAVLEPIELQITLL